eukprot:1911557-Rhodomonas_salina.1
MRCWRTPRLRLGTRTTLAQTTTGQRRSRNCVRRTTSEQVCLRCRYFCKRSQSRQHNADLSGGAEAQKKKNKVSSAVYLLALLQCSVLTSHLLVPQMSTKEKVELLENLLQKVAFPTSSYTVPHPVLKRSLLPGCCVHCFPPPAVISAVSLRLVCKAGY